MTDDQLCNAIETDKLEHNIKRMGKLLLQAMEDWDTVNLTEIDVFLNEFKLFFGSELSISAINRKPFNEYHAWKYEASSSIVQMLKLSKLNFNESVAAILNYYNN